MTMQNINQKNVALVNLDFIKKNTGNNPGFLKEMVQLFIANLPKDMNKLVEAKNNNDWQTVGAVAHKMKPNIDIIGVECLHETIRNIEKNARSESNLDEVAEEVSFMEEKVSQIQDELQEHLENL